MKNVTMIAHQYKINTVTCTPSEYTQEQVEKGLTNNSRYVRASSAYRADFTPTREQVERGLTDMWWEVRIAWARRKDYIPTAMQVERGLIDRDELVRKTWAMRMDFEPTSAQVERGLADVLVGKEWIERVRLCTEKSMQDDDYTISI